MDDNQNGLAQPFVIDDTTKFLATLTVDLVAKERDWIAQRLGWNLTSQSVLIAAVSLSPDKSKIFEIIVSGIPFLGIIISSLSIISVFAAYERICQIESEWQERQSKLVNFPIHPFGSPGIRIRGSVSSKYIPVTMLLFWTVFLFFHWYKP
jgi:hypothetical protein